MKRALDSDSEYVSGSDYSLSTNPTSKSSKRIKIEHEIFDKSIKEIEEMFSFKIQPKFAYDCINADFLPARASVPILPSQKTTQINTSRVVPRQGVAPPTMTLVDEADAELITTWNNRRVCLEKDLAIIERMVRGAK